MIEVIVSVGLSLGYFGLRSFFPPVSIKHVDEPPVGSETSCHRRQRICPPHATGHIKLRPVSCRVRVNRCGGAVFVTSGKMYLLVLVNAAKHLILRRRPLSKLLACAISSARSLNG